MDGLGHAFDHLGARETFPTKSVAILFEVNKRCREILNHHRVRPGVILSDYRDSSNTIGSAIAPLEDDDAFFKSLLSQLPELRLILVSSGSPCVGFTRAKTNRQGIKDPESEKLWVLPAAVARLDLLCKSLFSEVVNIAFICENADMTETPDDLRNRQAISDTLKVEPLVIQASKRCACDRIRSFWTNLIVDDFSPERVDVIQSLEPGWRPLWEYPSRIAQPDRRFSTFLRPFKIGQPKEFPAAYRRLSLHSYTDRSLVYRPDASAEDLAELARIVKSGIRIRTDNIRQKGSPAMIARGQVTDLIHQKGGDRFLRPLSGQERDRCLGFPAGASALPSDPSDVFSWDPLLSTGNAFAVPVISHILSPIASFMLSGTEVILQGNLPTTSDKTSALASLTPASSEGNDLRRTAPPAPADL